MEIFLCRSEVLTQCELWWCGGHHYGRKAEKRDEEFIVPSDIPTTSTDLHHFLLWAMLCLYIQAVPLSNSELFHFAPSGFPCFLSDNETHGRNFFGWPKKRRHHVGGWSRKKGSKKATHQTDNLLIGVPLLHPAQPLVVHVWQAGLRATDYREFYGCGSTAAITKTWGLWWGSSPAPWEAHPLKGGDSLSTIFLLFCHNF